MQNIFANHVTVCRDSPLPLRPSMLKGWEEFNSATGCSIPFCSGNDRVARRHVSPRTVSIYYYSSSIPKIDGISKDMFPIFDLQVILIPLYKPYTTCHFAPWHWCHAQVREVSMTVPPVPPPGAPEIDPA